MKKTTQQFNRSSFRKLNLSLTFLIYLSSMPAVDATPIDTARVDWLSVNNRLTAKDLV